MTIELRNIESLPDPQTHHHVSIARGDRMIHMAGQVGTDESGQAADGLAAQAERAARNVAAGLATAGATPDDESWPRVPITLIGVASLFEPELLIEIEATAVVSD